MTTTISGTFTHGVTLANSTDNPVYIAVGAQLSNTAAAALYADVNDGAGFPWTITNDGTVAGASGILLTLGGTITNTGSGQIHGASAGIAIGGAAGYVTNAGTITGGTAIAFAAGGRVTNASGGSITGDSVAVSIGGAAYLSNAGVITAKYGVTLANGGTLINAPGATIGAPDPNYPFRIYITGGFGAVINGGSIGSAGSDAVVSLGAGGVINNGPDGATSAFIAKVESDLGPTTVVNEATIGNAVVNGIVTNGLANPHAYIGSAYLRASAVLDNYGTIGSVNSGGYAAVSGAYGSTINNSGTIAGTLTGNGRGIDGAPIIQNNPGGRIAGNAYGVYLQDGGISNAGTILGLNANANGVRLGGFSDATVTNTGLITGGAYGIRAYSIRYPSSQYTTIINQGTISGAIGIGGYEAVTTLINAGTVIGTNGLAAEVQVLENLPGGEFIGRVHSHGRATLQLGTGAGAGTIQGMGSAYAGFHSLAITPGANWYMAGGNDVSATDITGNLTLANAVVAVDSYGSMSGAGTITSLDGVASSIVNQGSIVTDDLATLEFGATIVNTGTFEATSGSTLRITGIVRGVPVPPVGQVSPLDTGAENGGQFNNEDGGTMEFSAGIDASQVVDFGATGTSQVDIDDLVDFDAAMNDFGVGDVADIGGVAADFGAVEDGGPGPNAVGGIVTGAVAAIKVLSIGSNNAVIKQIELTGDNIAPFVHLQPDGAGGTLIIGSATPCFAAGTRILTACGEAPVEGLAIGARVVTLSGRQRRVRWIGHTSVDLGGYPDPATAAPVRVRAHAFAAGVPHRDVLLSPDHAVHVNGALMPVRHLVNGATIVRVSFKTVHYWHVELAAHAVVLADGLPAESYLDTGNRAAFDGGRAGAIRQSHG